MSTFHPNALTVGHVNRRARATMGRLEFVGKLGGFQHSTRWAHDGRMDRPQADWDVVPAGCDTTFDVGAHTFTAATGDRSTIEILEEETA